MDSGKSFLWTEGNSFRWSELIPADCYCTTSSKETANPAVEISFKNVAKVKGLEATVFQEIRLGRLWVKKEIRIA